MVAVTDKLPTATGRDEDFFLRSAIVMAVLIAVGFTLQLALGRSSFVSPHLVHAHAIVFMGWVAIYALLSRFHPQRQFWHDAFAGTRLVSSEPPKKA